MSVAFSATKGRLQVNTSTKLGSLDTTGQGDKETRRQEVDRWATQADALPVGVRAGVKLANVHNVVVVLENSRCTEHMKGCGTEGEGQDPSLGLPLLWYMSK